MSLTQQEPLMTREAYYAWVEQQPRGRYERLEGKVYAMAAERLGHVRMKAAVWLALRNAIRAASLACEAFSDGVTVPTGDSDFEPDALVTCSGRRPGDTMTVTDPVIVVEVISPGTKSIDTGAKFAGYFALPSVSHYLVIDPSQPLVIHHRRGTGPAIETQILRAGMMTLDPPGLVLEIAALYEGVL